MTTRVKVKATSDVEVIRAARRVLVTGGLGYVGQYVVRGLVSAGTGRVVCLDVRQPRPEEQVADVVYVTHDIRAPGLGPLLRAHRIDTVVHLATVVGGGHRFTREEMHAIDVGGTENLLAACVESGVARLVAVSSGAAYGYHASNAPLLREDDPLRGHREFAYAEHKREVEELLARYRTAHPELVQLVLRPGTILGAHSRGPIHDFLQQRVLIGVRGSATPFVLIWDEDVAAILVAGALGDQVGIYNLAGDGVVTLREMAKALGKPFVSLPAWVLKAALTALRRAGLTQFGPEQLDFLRYRPVLDNRALKEEFGYRPRKSTREVLELYRAVTAVAR